MESRIIRQVNLKPANLKKEDRAYTNLVYVSANTYEKFQIANEGKTPVYAMINGYVLTLGIDSYSDEEIGLNKITRQVLQISLVNDVVVQFFKPAIDQVYTLKQINIEVQVLRVATGGKLEIDDSELSACIKQAYPQQFVQSGQVILMDYNKNAISLKVNYIEIVKINVKEIDKMSEIRDYGMIVDETDFAFTAKNSKELTLKSATKKGMKVVDDGFTFDTLGVGGLNKEITEIFRRALAARRLSPAILKKYGRSHVQGVLLYGPPGCGKTLVARQLGKALQAYEVKVVNGPEIMSKFVGQSEENIRKLFVNARQNEQQYGDQSPLSIIVFDEFDAIAKQRGTVQNGTGVNDSVVNQLLSMIDGVDSLNNILIIGMTNRKDMIDQAIMRPGRFQVHVEVGLPDQAGRVEIFNIHTADMKKNQVLDPKVNIEELARISKNFTGADIKSVVSNATSYTFAEKFGLLDFSKPLDIKDDALVTMEDFERAIKQVKPQFGQDTEKFKVYLRKEPLDYGEKFQKLKKILQNAIDQTIKGKNSQLNSILLEGDVGSGQTTMAAWAGQICDFPYVKIISPQNFVGFTENGKVNSIVQVFDDAYRSPHSCIILDNIQRILEYIDIGPRFSNPILQALLVLVQKIPKDENNRVLIIGTTSCASLLQNLEITDCFNMVVNVPNITQAEEVKQILANYNLQSEKDLQLIASEAKNLPIKKLLTILDMVQSQETSIITHEGFVEALNSLIQF